MQVVFETARLRAVPWRDDHAGVAYDAYSQPDFVRYLGNPQPHPSLEHTRTWIRRIAERQVGAAHGFWAVETLAGGALVGAALCMPIPDGNGEHEIGWHVFPEHQGHGYATEIGAGAARYGFDVLGLEQVIAVVVPENAPSLAVARRIGMTACGRTRRYYGVEVELFRLLNPAKA